MAVKTNLGNKQTSARRFSAIPVLFNEYCTQKLTLIQNLYSCAHMIMRSMFAKSAFSFGSSLDVLKINVSISDDFHQPFKRFELSVQKNC